MTQQRRAKAIMIQGTMSNAGKSLLAAGLCRIFRQDGYRVAPFKAQNMALNSFITREGLEMGRAQVVQAEAAGIEPSVLMNPVLLKPTNDTASQVIVNGEVLANMSAREYYRRKREIVPEIRRAYETLASQYDIIVIEGAGSPAEINLQENDVVNMFMAHLAKAPVLLAGDIDRGGVFASLVGTMLLFSPEDRAMVKATLINKFRGDKTILQPGLDMLEEKIGIPAVGVIPYLHVDIDDEDSLTERFSRKKEIGLIDIAVIRLPRISNFTDFNVLECAPGVTLRYVDRLAELGDPDMILLPGTKNTMADLIWLRESGIEAAVLKQAARGKIVFGICGGFQMLGCVLEDPCGVEHGGAMKGMGLLPVVTVFEEEKTRTQVSGRFAENVCGDLSGLSGTAFSGYEIHMGKTTFLSEGSKEKRPRRLTGILQVTGAHTPCGVEKNSAEEGGRQTEERLSGLCCGNVYGSYIHGIFDEEAVVKAVVSALYRSKGLSESTVASMDLAGYKQRQYDLLAQSMRDNLDMDMLYRILEAGVDE